MSTGWIKLHRELIKKPIWQCSTPEQKVILITLLMMANHDTKEWEWKGEKYHCKPGEFVTSAKSIQKEAGEGISRQNIRTALKRFEKYEFLTIETTKVNTKIFIQNWEKYQSKEQQPNQDANHQLTISQPTANHQLTTNKNDKNDKNDIFIPPTLEEVVSYCKERNNSVDPQKWYDFYSAKGWMIGKNKMKDWKAAVRTWERGCDSKPQKSKYRDMTNYQPGE